jgi:hypothetical protein
MLGRTLASLIRSFALAVGFVAVSLWPWAASAQVAVAPLSPISPIINGNPGQLSAGFVPLNPAAQQWGTPSRFGVGAFRGETDVIKQGTYDYDGKLAGLRLVGMTFGFSAEQLSIAGTDPNTLEDFTQSQSNAGLSVRLFAPIAIGVGYGKQDLDAGTITQTVTTTTLGGSLRIGEIIYLGVAGGEDTRDSKDTSIPNSSTDDRNFYLYGIGIRRGGPFSFHVEWYASDRDAYNLGKIKTSDLTSQTGVLEIGFWSFVFGGRVAKVDLERNGNRYKTDAAIYDFAWAPFRGLTLGGRYEVTKEKDEGSGVKAENEIRAVTVGWQF